MKKITKKTTILLLLLVMVACAVTLCACKGNPLSRDDLINQGYSVVVTYDFNGGVNNNGVKKLTVYVRPNSRIPEPNGTDTSFGSAPTQAGKSLRGFYEGAKQEDGSIKYASTPWNFATDRVQKDTTLYALWWDNYTVAVHCDNVAGQDTVREITIKRNAQTGEAETVLAGYLSATQLGMSGRTIISYFTDADRKPEHEITFPANLNFRDEEGGRVIDIYVESIEGVWSVIRTADEFAANMSASATNRNFYIKNDINMEGRAVQFPASYMGKFEGNGHTISNVTVSRAITSGTMVTAYLGMFGEIKSGAQIKNVTFSGVTLTLDTSGGRNISEIYLGMLAGKIFNGATLTDVTVSGTVTYAQRSGAYIEANKLAGEIENNVNTDTCHYDDVTLQQQ